MNNPGAINYLGNAGASILGNYQNQNNLNTITSPTSEKHSSNIVLRNQMHAQFSTQGRPANHTSLKSTLSNGTTISNGGIVIAVEELEVKYFTSLIMISEKNRRAA